MTSGSGSANETPDDVDVDDKASSAADAWYSDPLYQRYWRHYQLAAAWYGYHCHLVASVSPHHQQGSRPWPPSHHGAGPSTWPGGWQRPQNSAQTTPASDLDLQDSCHGDRHSHRKPHKRKRKSKAKQRNEARRRDLEFEMEITPEMKEFFVTSAKHRQERDAQQREEDKNDDYIDLTEVTAHTKRRTGAAPTEKPGQRRTSQMKLLYGAGAAMIHGMETALQLNFDRNFDLKTPKLWPHLPLNITFHS